MKEKDKLILEALQVLRGSVNMLHRAANENCLTEENRMKVIIFTLKSGLECDFSELTGLINPSVNDEKLKQAAEAAMEVDNRVKSYRLEDKE